MKRSEPEDLRQYITHALMGVENRLRDDLRQFITRTSAGAEDRLHEDLKQLIDARLNQTEGRLGGLEDRFSVLEQKVDDGFAGIGDAIELIHVRIDENAWPFSNESLA